MSNSSSCAPSAPSTTERTRGVATATTFAIAALIALLGARAFVGVVEPGLYQRETASYRVQAIAQDWVDLLVALPWLLVTAHAARRGSRRARLLLGGVLLYTTYEFAIYAFAVHFNALFLVYCAGLGVSSFALVTTASLLRDQARSWFSGATRMRAPGGFLLALGAAFALLWLSELLPALVRGAVPPSVAAAGLLTSPVHVLDLSLVLPAHFAVGFLLCRRRPLGFAFAPMLLSFDALMALSIAAIALAMFVRGALPTLSVVAVMLAVCLASAGLLRTLLGALKS